ncbi:hypothetical protein GCM10027415_28400 [Humibacter ginsengisoli]
MDGGVLFVSDAHGRIPRVLSVAGSDPTGGAGIQADLKSIAANRGYGMAVVTALVAQNTRGVRAMHVPGAGFLTEQLRAVSDDVAIDAVKIGMLADAESVGAVAHWLHTTRPPRVVLDPVLLSSSGHRLLDAAGERALPALFEAVDVITPNLDELAALTRAPRAGTWRDALEQASLLSAAYDMIVLVTGGHAEGPASTDALVDAGGRLGKHGSLFEATSPRIHTRNTHGTGCSLSSAIATIQARVNDWPRALVAAKQWLHDSLAHADELDVGSGAGPLHHFHALWEGVETRALPGIHVSVQDARALTSSAAT